MSKSNNTGGGVGVTGLLLVAFIVLKLTDVISWSWWWVLSPAWGSVVLVLFVVFCCMAISVIKLVFEHAKRNKEIKTKYDL